MRKTTIGMNFSKKNTDYFREVLKTIHLKNALFTGVLRAQKLVLWFLISLKKVSFISSFW